MRLVIVDSAGRNAETARGVQKAVLAMIQLGYEMMPADPSV